MQRGGGACGRRLDELVARGVPRILLLGRHEGERALLRCGLDCEYQLSAHRHGARRGASMKRCEKSTRIARHARFSAMVFCALPSLPSSAGGFGGRTGSIVTAAGHRLSAPAHVRRASPASKAAGHPVCETHPTERRNFREETRTAAHGSAAPFV